MRAPDVELASDRLLETAHPDCARTYDRIAPLYDLLDAAYERLWKGRLRAELFAHAQGRVLDVGIGTGANIPHYPEACADVGIVGDEAGARAPQAALEAVRDHAAGVVGELLARGEGLGQHRRVEVQDD